MSNFIFKNLNATIYMFVSSLSARMRKQFRRFTSSFEDTTRIKHAVQCFFVDINKLWVDLAEGSLLFQIRLSIFDLHKDKRHTKLTRTVWYTSLHENSSIILLNNCISWRLLNNWHYSGERVSLSWDQNNADSYKFQHNYKRYLINSPTEASVFNFVARLPAWVKANVTERM